MYRYTEAVGGVMINVDEKFKHMQIKQAAPAPAPGAAAAPATGNADDAFGGAVHVDSP